MVLDLIRPILYRNRVLGHFVRFWLNIIYFKDFITYSYSTYLT